VRTYRTLLAGSVAMMALAACSSGGAGGSSSHGISGPIKLVGLWEVKGESPAAIDDYQNGAALAIEQITAAGGIAGKPVTLDRVPLSPSDPQKATSQFL
jgi:branched-chain amino acid transport system substrate-binding protein